MSCIFPLSGSCSLGGTHRMMDIYDARALKSRTITHALLFILQGIVLPATNLAKSRTILALVNTLWS